MKGRLRTQLVVIYGILMVVSLGLLGWIQQKGIPGTRLLGWERIFTEQSMSQIIRIADIKTSQLQSSLEANQRAFLVLAHNQETSELACSPQTPGNRKKLTDKVNEFLLNSGFSTIRFVRATDAMILHSSQNGEAGTVFSRRHVLESTVLADQVGVNPLLDSDGELQLSLYFSLAGPPQCERIILVGEYSPKILFTHTLRIGRELGNTGAIDIVDQQGKVMASSDPSILWDMQLPPLYKLAGAGSEGFDVATLDFGQKVVCAFRHIQLSSEYGWGVIVRQSSLELEAPIQQGTRISIIMVFLAILIALFAAMIIARSLTGSLRHLVKVANRFSEGDYTQRTLIKKNGEIGEVALAFDNMATHLQKTMKELGSAKIAADEANLQLQETMHELEHLVDTDRLTGAWNRRYFDSMIERESRRADRYGLPLSLTIFDIDHFKLINDTHGHDCGDQILIEIVNRVREQIRGSDALIRWGGEEFVVISSSTTHSGATALAEKIRACIARTPFSTVGTVTISLGVVQYHPGEPRRELIQRADKLLYAAKRSGRNRVIASTRGGDGHEPFRLEWQKRFLCGDDIIDNEHQELFAQINHLMSSLISGNEVEKSLAILPTLSTVLSKHYKDEERIMAQIEFSELEIHQAEHDRILQELSTVESRLRDGSLHPVDFVEFLIRKVAIGHLIAYDLLFFPILRRRKAALPE